jgi:hypothetical protein
MCTCIYIHAYTRLCYAQLYLHTWTPVHVRANTSAHTRARASAAPPRTTARAASTTPPSASRLHWRAARGAKKGGANIVQRGDTGGVPRADVRIERVRRAERLRAEPPAVHADRTRSHASARMRGRAVAHAHARARTDAARGARVCGGPASAIRSSV